MILMCPLVVDRVVPTGALRLDWEEPSLGRVRDGSGVVRGQPRPLAYRASVVSAITLTLGAVYIRLGGRATYLARR